MQAPGLKRVTVCVCALATLVLLAHPAQATLYHDRAQFMADLAGFPTFTDDYESYPLGLLLPGSALGDFLYNSDPAVTQPAVAGDFAGGQALGGALADVFVGGDSVTLIYQPPLLPDGPPLYAFGVDFAYAPSFDSIPADTYRLTIADGSAAGQFVGNLELDSAGGTFFLGIILDSADAFTAVTVSSVQTDPSFLVPAYQTDNLIYAVVPEPPTLAMLVLGSVMMTALAFRQRNGVFAVYANATALPKNLE